MHPKDSKTNNIDSNDRTIITVNDTGKEEIELRAREGEEGGVTITAAAAERTEVLYGEDKTTDTLLQAFSNAKSTWNICTNSTGPSVSMGVEPIKRGTVDLKERGVRIRYSTEITKENISYCKELMKIAEVRHLDGVKGGMAVSEKEYVATAVLQEAKAIPHLIHSNVKEIVEHQQYMFDTLWGKSIPAEQKIREIEEGITPDIIEVIQNSSKAKDLYMNIVKDAVEEILLIFPTINAFIRQEKIGVIQWLTEVVTKEQYNKLKVRILMPIHKSTEQTVQDLKQQCHQNNIDVRFIEQSAGSKATFLVVDRKVSLVMELKDDSKETFDRAIGLSIYSNSKSGVLSFVAIFENLWIQSELYLQVKEANEQLKIHDKIMNEFINVASHELRTPIQPILGISRVLRSKIKNDEQLVLLDIIIRNAKRLQRLTEDILDVARIESRSLKLNNELFELNGIILNVIQDVKDRIDNLKVKLLYDVNDVKGDIISVEADKGRMIQVISNLLNNAIKFTKEGSISINIERKEDNQHVIISVKDTGEGINPEILPILFSKYATKSFEGSGLGLGLFICKSIVEAHGGKIWAENNSDGKGATFAFSLPIN
ncbi:MAG TPA: HAMP domain-containing sensor histidine kinase [Nitrososphaeraceae archaeon]|nr:HAMP domain-containing sensor histidine kinase [Nitrososphaeraceae archaeon]